MADSPFSSDRDDADNRTLLQDRIIAFLFTDIEESTGQAQLYPEGMREAHARHDQIIERAVQTFGGHLYRSEGDGFRIAFADPVAALLSAFEAQRALQTVFVDPAGALPLRARMALHAGLTEERNGEYIGLTPAKSARLLETIHGGQIVITGETEALVKNRLPQEARLHDMGEHSLRSFLTPDRLFQLTHPDLPANFPPLKPTSSVPNNLPRQLTQFIGRDGEVGEVRQRVVTSPLVTLTGAGGCGKTRLSLQVADNFLRKFPDGVWFIELARCDDEEAMARATATALGVKQESETPLRQQIIQHLNGQQCLLILDNCEHLVEAAARFAAELLASCRELRILATSREPLNILGETLYAVRPLPVPPESVAEAKQAMDYDSVRLFALHAGKRTAFALNAENVLPVARICRALAGIPLAIVLLASWSDMLTPAQMEKRMKDYFRDIKTAGDPTLLDHHRSLLSTIDYSFDLLNESERALLPRLAIFSGGWTWEAAEEICAAPPVEDVFDSLAQLVRKSLVEADDTPNGKRYRLLQPIREYAMDILKKEGEYDAIRSSHRDFFIQWATNMWPDITGKRIGSDSRAALLQVDNEIDNLRTTLNTAGSITNGLRLIFALGWYWYIRGYTREGLEWATKFVEMDSKSPIDDLMLRAEARNNTGLLYWKSGELASANRLFTEALIIERERNNEAAIAKCLNNLGSIVWRQGHREQSTLYLQESLRLYEKLGVEERIADAATSLAANFLNEDKYDEARSLLVRALDLHRKHSNNLMTASTLQNMGNAERKLGELDKAILTLKQSLQIHREFGFLPGISALMSEIALVTYAAKAYNHTAIAIGFINALREKAFATESLTIDSDPEIDFASIALPQILGLDHYVNSEKLGRSLDIDEVIAIISE